ncbi:MAG TPA: tRNA dihydrouridine synthase DusB [Tepidisphaeraceae bacterium]|nr:tRNA dihydrouridine synthase DusB [Tepidisphaeraceae bacterium]
MLTIGNVKLATNLLLAPIAGYCDLSFRLVARSCGGVGMACTDLLCPQGVLRENYHSMILAMTSPEDKPLCMQLYGADADLLCDAARWAEDRGADVIDINMGCPVDKVTKKNGGSKLLCDPDNTMRMVEKIVKVLRQVPLTAKLRLGWDDTCIVAPQLAARLENAGIALITIHGRTTEMRFSGEARLDGIASVVAAIKKIPVIGNGDVRRPQDAKRMIDYTKCAGVMIARGALSMPWIFRDTHSYLTTGIIPPPPTLEEKCQLIRDHFWNLMRYRNERIALLELRKRISWYAKSMHPCKRLREKMRVMQSADEFEQIMGEFLEWRKERDQRQQARQMDEIEADSSLVDPLPSAISA